MKKNKSTTQDTIYHHKIKREIKYIKDIPKEEMHLYKFEFSTEKKMDRTNEIYHLPIIVSQRDLEIEKMYLEKYNDEYWKNYKPKKFANKELE